MAEAADIEAVYAAFASDPLTETAGCACCVSPADQARLRRAPLRELEADDLERYAFKAMSTWGDARDYRHFLPRILELAVSGEHRDRLGLDLGVIGRKLEAAGFAAWRAVERDAVAALFRGAWTATLADPDLATSTIEISVALATVVPFAELLARWAETPGTELHVAAAIMDVWTMSAGPLRASLRAWLRDPARGAQLEAAFVAALDTPIADDLARARDQWELLAAESP